MKKLFIFASVLTTFFVGCTSIYDAPELPSNDIKYTGKYISPDEAYDIALKGLEEFGFQNSRRSRFASVYLYNEANKSRKSSEQDSTFYIVNFTEGGFAVVAAKRDVLNPIFGIAENGNFDTENNPNLQYYMNIGKECYAERNPLLPIRPWNPPLDTTMHNLGNIQFDSTVTYTNRYVPTKWGQLYPYNAYCPPRENGNGNQPVGCLALAISQILAFHRYPSEFIFENTKYVLDWNEILLCNNLEDLEYTSLLGTSQAQRLLSVMGKMLNSKYSDDKTTAFLGDAAPVLWSLNYNASNLKFHPTIEECITALRDYGPILIAGDIKNKPTEGSEGHGWIVDAVKIKKIYWPGTSQTEKTLFGTHYYFNMNWGVCGKGDGFYIVPSTLDTINASSATIYHKIRVITNINPAP